VITLLASLPRLYQYISIDIVISICYNYNILAYNNQREQSFLSKTELEWLLGKKQLSGSYNRKIMHQIRKKLENFESFELPLLIERGLLSLSPVTKFSNGVTKNSSADIHSSSSNSEICAQMKSLGRDLIPRPFPYQGNALPG
jgi:hypothetical protein